MRWDGTITLGSLLQMITMVGLVFAAWSAIRVRLEAFGKILEMHAKSLEAHAQRLDRHEDRILDLVGELQRVVGRTERVPR